MEPSLPGLVGACVGAGIGWINARIVGGVVAGRLRALETGNPGSAPQDFERKLAIFRIVVSVIFIGGTAAVGYGFGHALAG